MRLRIALPVVLVALMGLIFGLLPSASAHKNTWTKAVVTGEVNWPGGSKDRDDAKSYTLQRGVGDADLTLDRRAVGNGGPDEGADLNGCRGDNPYGPIKDHPLAGPVNVGGALPLTGNSSDLCFRFQNTVIAAAGVFEGVKHSTLFSCLASGTNGASGTTLDEQPDRLGSFYGEFACDAMPDDSPLASLATADGHFHGLALDDAGAFGFLGEVDCTVPTSKIPETVGETCPAPPAGNPTKLYDESRIKHTLACKGQLEPVTIVTKLRVLETPLDPTNQRPALLSALVELACIIA